MDRSYANMGISILPVVVIAAMLAWLGRAFSTDQRANRERLRGKSRVVKTRCGPIEYVDIGTGPAILVVHGAGGGFDQGIEFAEPIAKAGYRVVAMSRFGYLQTPMPVDASPAAQADAHVALLDALGIHRTAVLGASAGAPSAMQFVLRHADRCLAFCAHGISTSNRTCGGSFSFTRCREITHVPCRLRVRLLDGTQADA
jgi:2-hydroxy-6-oxonona-2,4-dienedioate hydrolase